MRALALLVGLALLVASPLASQTVPQFQVDPSWPKPLPNNWLLGQVAHIAIDSSDHVSVLQRPPRSDIGLARNFFFGPV